MKSIRFLTGYFLALAMIFTLSQASASAQDRSPAGKTSASVKMVDSQSPLPGKSININQASLEQLSEIKGVGPVMAKRILEFREKNGSFKKMEDLLSVKGIGEKKLESIKPQITL